MKQRIHTVLSTALMAAGLIAGGSALAADPAKPTTSMTQGGDYGNAADKKPTTAEGVQQRATQPSTSVLDDNAQRAHDRSQGATPQTSDSTAGTTRDGQMTGPSGSDRLPSSSGSSGDSTGKTTNGGTTGGSMDSNGSTSGSAGSTSGSTNSDATMKDADRAAADTNHDNLISPEEMSAWLQKQQGTAQQPAPQK
jgi:hypothetical protein